MSGLVGAKVRIEGNPRLGALRRRVTNKRALLQVAGRAGRNTMVKHLRARNRSHPNKLGGRRTNYWAKAAEATQFVLVETSGQGGAVEISSSMIGLALRYHGTGGLPGGVLRPTTGRYLTEPAAPEAHGKRAREFPDLKFGFAKDPKTGRMRPALVRDSAGMTAIPKRASAAGLRYRADLPGEGEDAEPVFWLNLKARMKGDETVLPPEGQIGDEAMEAVDEYVGILIERGDA